MTYKLWEESLLKYLKSLNEEEKSGILGYYREMYNDKMETGISESEIVESFGDPMLAAARILKESGDSAEDLYSEERGTAETESSADEETEVASAPVSNKTERKRSEGASTISASRIVYWVLITLVFTIPLIAVVISVIASLAALTVTGGAMLFGGVLGAVASPFLLLFGNTLPSVLLVLGGTLTIAGVGALLFISFYYITKYSIVSTYKIARHVARRKK